MFYPPARAVSNSITVWNSSVLAACPAPLLTGAPNAAAVVHVASLSADGTPLLVGVSNAAAVLANLREERHILK
jgi:hypothetical protein